MSLSKSTPRLFPLPSPPIDGTAYKLWKREVIAEVSRAVSAWLYSGEEYVAPERFNNPRA